MVMVAGDGDERLWLGPPTPRSHVANRERQREERQGWTLVKRRSRGCNRRNMAFLPRGPRRTRAATVTATVVGSTWTRRSKKRPWPRGPRAKMLSFNHHHWWRGLVPHTRPWWARSRLVRSPNGRCIRLRGRTTPTGPEETQAFGGDPTVSLALP